MKKSNLLSIIFLTVFCLLFFAYFSANATNLNNAFQPAPLDDAATKAGYEVGNGIFYQNINIIIPIIIKTVLSLLGVIFIVLIIYGGITWMTAGGEEAKVEKAQKIIRSAIIGLIIVVAAYAISYFVINALSQRTLV